MGRKRTRTGQFLFLCLACLNLLFLTNCASFQKIIAPPPEVPPKKDQKLPDNLQAAYEGLERAAKLLKKGDYNGSLKENEKVLSLVGKNTPGDRAVFNMALIHSHEQNPQKNYEKSLYFYNKFRQLKNSEIYPNPM